MIVTKVLVGSIVAFVLLMIAACTVRAEEPSSALTRALIAVESGGDNAVVGDQQLADMAYGCLQIRQPCVDDYNKANATTYKAKDCLGNRDLSVKICKWYIDHYTTESRLGHKSTDEDKSRVWNGGPNGFRKESTVKYWTRVQAQMK